MAAPTTAPGGGEAWISPYRRRICPGARLCGFPFCDLYIGLVGQVRPDLRANSERPARDGRHTEQDNMRATTHRPGMTTARSESAGFCYNVGGLVSST